MEQNQLKPSTSQNPNLTCSRPFPSLHFQPLDSNPCADENYWRYADARQQQQEMVAAAAAAAGMAPVATVAAAQMVGSTAAAMNQQAAAATMAQ